MRIKALRNTSASGQSLEAGQIYDISEADGAFLIKIRKAERHVDAPAAEKPKTKGKAGR